MRLQYQIYASQCRDIWGVTASVTNVWINLSAGRVDLCKDWTRSQLELFIYSKNVFKCLFDFYSTAVVLEFVFVLIWMLETRLLSQFTIHLNCLVMTKKSKENFSALIVVLTNSSVTCIITCTAVWQHLDGSFNAFGYHMAWTLEIVSGNYCSPQYHHYFLKAKQLLFFLWMLQWTVNLYLHQKF